MMRSALVATFFAPPQTRFGQGAQGQNADQADDSEYQDLHPKRPAEQCHSHGSQRAHGEPDGRQRNGEGFQKAQKDNQPQPDDTEQIHCASPFSIVFCF